MNIYSSMICRSVVLTLLLAVYSITILAADQNLSFELDTETHEHEYVHLKGAPSKDWTFIIYMAADNDLRTFAARNIKQMAQLGSNQFINIVVQLDIRITGNKKITRRYYIEKNRILHMNAEDPYTQKMDSGDPRTLISCCTWAIENYSAHNYALILWNHGTGVIDPETGRIINPAELFTFNPATNKLELDRTIGFLDFMHKDLIQMRQRTSEITENDAREKGVCWDDSTGNYLTNQKLEEALKTISLNLLNGNKLSIIGFDACLMSMLEVADIAKRYAHIMVGSQEVELGAGWDYEKVLRPFATSTLDPFSLASHIVAMYYETYNRITNDFTQSALNLDILEKLENNVNNIATILLECLRKQTNNSVKNAIQASRSKLLCTHFDEPSYLDMHHLFNNILSNIKYFTFLNDNEGNQLKSALMQSLSEGLSLIKATVFANKVGKNLSLAQGLSIYFPERRIHSSYRKTIFAANNKWINFLTQYLLL